MTLRFPRIRDIALDSKVYDGGHKVQVVASWNGLRSVWCRVSETDHPLTSGEVAQCQRLATRMLRILAHGPLSNRIPSLGALARIAPPLSAG